MQFKIYVGSRGGGGADDEFVLKMVYGKMSFSDTSFSDTTPST